MKHFEKIIVVALIVVAFSACRKGHDATQQDNADDHVFTPTDVIAPVIEIATPTTSQIFSSGTPITITGKLTDDYGLYQGSIRITNDATNAVVKEQLYEIHGFLTYNYNLSYTPSVTVASDYTVTVKFEDHGLNVTTKAVKIKVNP